MHCYLCFTYVMLACSARPHDRDASAPQRRSLFHDVIQSLRLRARLPADLAAAGNDLAADDDYGFDVDPLHQPADRDFLPRRNDRLEMPTLNYRFPKNLDRNETKDAPETLKEEIVLFINASDEEGDEATTVKPKKTKRTKPPIKNKNKTKTNEEDPNDINTTTEQRPVSNTMSGQSQIGNRDSQTVVKPTVIVNFRGSVSHRESDIRLERRKYNATRADRPHNIFNINQEIKLESARPSLGSTGGVKRLPGRVRQHITIRAEGDATVEEDMMMCETSARQEGERRAGAPDVLRVVLTV